MKFKTELIQPGRLTPREAEIMLLVCDAMSDKDISRTLAISLNTVSRHLHAIYVKMGIYHSRLNRRVSMTREALSQGMVRLL